MRLQGKTALINGGSSGIELATARLLRRQHGGEQRAAVAERRYVGGACPNIACMPSKNQIWSVRIAYLARHAAMPSIPAPLARDGRQWRQI